MHSNVVTTRRRARTSGRGFSLVEVIAVLVIVSILSVSAWAVTQRSYQTRQRAAARQLVNDFMYIRELALTTGQNTWAKVYISSNKVRYYQTPLGAATTSSAATNLTDPTTGNQMITYLGTSSANSIYAGVSIGTFNGGTSSTNWIGFDWLGRPTDLNGTLLTAAIPITITTGGVYSDITFTVQPETGLTTITNMPAN